MKKHKVLVFFNDMLVFILGGIIYSLAVLLFLSGNKISPRRDNRYCDNSQLSFRGARGHRRAFAELAVIDFGLFKARRHFCNENRRGNRCYVGDP